MNRRETLKKGAFLVVIILSVSAVLIYLQKLIGLEKIREVIIRAGVWGPIIYIFLHLLTHIFAPIQGSPLMIVALAIFGKQALIYTYCVGVLSGFTNFWIARKLGRDVVIRLVGKEGMSRIDRVAAKEGAKALLIMRIFQGFITDFVSYAAGLTSIKFSTYYLISILAPLPSTLIWFAFFDSIPQQYAFTTMLVLGSIFFITPPLYYFLKYRLRERFH